MRLALVAVLALAASSARAQSRDLFQVDTLNDLSGSQNGFNIDSCKTDASHTVDLRLSGLTQPTYTLRFITYPDTGPGAPCPSDMLDPLAVEVIPPTSETPLSGNLVVQKQIKTSALLGGTSGACADGKGKRDNLNFCFQLTVLPSDVTTSFADPGMKLDFDTQAPPAPLAPTVTASDTSITLQVPPPSTGTLDTFSYIALFRVCPSESGEGEGEGEGEGQALTTGEGEGEGAAGDSLCGAVGQFHETTPTTDAKIVIGSLTTGDSVEYKVVLEDDFGNRGPAGALLLATTKPDVSPLQLYDGAGSQISCSPSCTDTSSTSTTAAGFFGVLFLISRRGRRLLKAIARRGAVGALLITAVAFGATSARADFGQITVGMGVSPYKPAIDNELIPPTNRAVFPIYGCAFKGATLLEIGGDVDEHVFDDFGSLQLSVGFNVSQAQGFAQDTSVLTTGTCGKPTKTPVQLTMAKFRPGITYRFDPALDAWGVPLVPYARLGLVAEGYAFTKDGSPDNKGSVDPLGVRFGWEAAGGLMLALDFLDSIDPFLPDTTMRGKANGAFDHTFLYVEAAWQPVSGYGTPGFVFSNDDTFFQTHLPVVWKLGIAVELL